MAEEDQYGLDGAIREFEGSAFADSDPASARLRGLEGRYAVAYSLLAVDMNGLLTYTPNRQGTVDKYRLRHIGNTAASLARFLRDHSVDRRYGEHIDAVVSALNEITAVVKAGPEKKKERACSVS